MTFLEGEQSNQKLTGLMIYTYARTKQSIRTNHSGTPEFYTEQDDAWISNLALHVRNGEFEANFIKRIPCACVWMCAYQFVWARPLIRSREDRREWGALAAKIGPQRNDSFRG